VDLRGAEGIIDGSRFDDAMKISPRMSLTLFAALVLLAACDRKQADPAEAAAKEDSKKQRYALPGLDHGLLQSPVNILLHHA